MRRLTQELRSRPDAAGRRPLLHPPLRPRVTASLQLPPRLRIPVSPRTPRAPAAYRSLGRRPLPRRSPGRHRLQIENFACTPQADRLGLYSPQSGLVFNQDSKVSKIQQSKL